MKEKTRQSGITAVQTVLILENHIVAAFKEGFDSLNQIVK